MSDYITIYQQWQAVKLQVRKAREWKDTEKYQELKKKERALLAKLNESMR